MIDKEKFEQYKIFVEEHRSLTDLSWKIFAIASTILFAVPFAFRNNITLFKSFRIENLILGGIGLVVTACIFWALFNYRRRENALENHIISIENHLPDKGFTELRKAKEAPFFSFLPKSLHSELLNENRWAMGLIFIILMWLYGAIVLTQLWLYYLN